MLADTAVASHEQERSDISDKFFSPFTRARVPFQCPAMFRGLNVSVPVNGRLPFVAFYRRWGTLIPSKRS